MRQQSRPRLHYGNTEYLIRCQWPKGGLAAGFYPYHSLSYLHDGDKCGALDLKDPNLRQLIKIESCQPIVVAALDMFMVLRLGATLLPKKKERHSKIILSNVKCAQDVQIGSEARVH